MKDIEQRMFYHMRRVMYNIKCNVVVVVDGGVARSMVVVEERKASWEIP